MPIRHVPQQLVLDLDGTLTNNKKEITPRTKQALMQAQAAGVHVVLASGRPTYGIVPLAEELKLKDNGGYILAFNADDLREARGRNVDGAAHERDVGAAQHRLPRYGVSHATGRTIGQEAHRIERFAGRPGGHDDARAGKVFHAHARAHRPVDELVDRGKLSIAHLSAGESDKVRKAVAKKKIKLMQEVVLPMYEVRTAAINSCG